MKPSVSVIICTVNENTATLENCLRSYLSQIEVKLQLLIATLPGDSSVNVAKRLNIPDENVILCPEKGIYPQLLHAMQYVTGDWFQYGSGNDLMNPDKLIIEIKRCIAFSAKICYSDFHTMNEGDQQRTVSRFPDSFDYELFLDYFNTGYHPGKNGGNFISDCSLIHRTILEKYLPYRYEKWGNYAHYDFWLRVAEGEGPAVFCHNQIPTWTYIISNQSKHVKRMSNPKEQQEYYNTCREMLKTHIDKTCVLLPENPFVFLNQSELLMTTEVLTGPEIITGAVNTIPDDVRMLTVALPAFCSKDIYWLAMESLATQKNIDFPWELIIAEEQNSGMAGRNAFIKYKAALSRNYCCRIIYIPVEKKMSLCEKWRMIADAAHKQSFGFLLQSCDCYSYPNRLKDTYDHLIQGYDWFQTVNGFFYDIGGKILVEYNGRTYPKASTHLNMAFRTEYAKRLSNAKLKSGIDSWLFDECKKIKLSDDSAFNFANHHIPEESGYGVDTNGANTISGSRGGNFHNPLPPFITTNKTISDILPEKIINRLQALYEKRRKKIPLSTDMAFNILSTRIRQCYTSGSLQHFEEGFHNRYQLEKYIQDDRPAIFFGVYNEADYNRIIQHKSLAVVVFGGSDTMAPPEKLKRLKKDNVKLISGSNWINKDLERAGLDYKFLPISIVGDGTNKFNYSAAPLGDKIYIYTASVCPQFYGSELYSRLIDRFGYNNFIIAEKSSFNKEYLLERYKNSFVGLRLVNHDGLSETVCELGLLGRKVIYNGCEPNALNYGSYEDIERIILQQKERIGQTDHELSHKMREYLDLKDEWLHTDYWE